MSPPPEVKIDMKVGEVREGGKATALEVGRHEGPLTLQVFGTPPGDVKRFLAPPAARRTFVNRDRELGEIVSAVQSRGRVLLHGMPGIGKTALAIAAAQKVHGAGSFKDGILWVSDIRRAPIESVCDAIARRLGQQEIPRLPPGEKPDAIRELLAASGELFLVLDHLDSGDTAQWVVDRTVPENVAVLIASRIRHPVGGLEIPVKPLDPDSAALLFRQESGAAERDAGVAREICSLLENHPLALVLAAGRVRIENMPLTRLKERLEKETGLDSLRLGEGEDKSRSVWASLELSYAELDEKHCRVLGRLCACFDRPVGLQLLAEITGLSLDECEDCVGRLVSRSLAERSEDRVGVQRLVRDFGRRRLGSELPAVQDRVAEAVRSYLSRYSEKSPLHYDLLEAEAGNLIGSARYAASRGDWAAVLQVVQTLASPVSGVLSVRGYWTELVLLLQLGIQAAEKSNDPRLLARFKHNLATICQSRGDYSEAQRLYQENLAFFRGEADRRATAATLHNFGVLSRLRGEHQEARRYLQESREIKEDPQYEKYLSTTMHELGQLAERETDFEAALQFYSKSIELDAKYPDPVGTAANWQQIGVIKQIQGDPDEAERLYLHALEVYRQFSDRSRIAYLHFSLGRLRSEKGDFDGAMSLLGESLKASKALGARSLQGDVLYELGVVSRERGRSEEAGSFFEQSLKIQTSLGAAEGLAFCQSRVGRLAREAGRFPEALRLEETALAAFRKLGNRLGMADCLCELGALALASGNHQEAGKMYRESLQGSEDVGYKLGAARSLYGLGNLEEKRGNRPEAGNHYRRALEISSLLGSPLAESVRRKLEGLEKAG
jgi:tetratricopeptide (TPR) repeat protein